MNSNKKTDDVENKITISADDCENVIKYCNHFGVASSPDLDIALDKFKNDSSYENQMEVKLEICKWILTCNHDSFNDNLWDAPKKAAESVVFDLQFDRDLKEELTNDDDIE